MSDAASKPSPLRRKGAKLLAVGVLLGLVGIGLAVRQIGYLAWPSVEAEIVAARVRRQVARDRPGGPEFATFRPEVSYRFIGSDGQPQTVTNFANQWSKQSQAAETFIAEHPVGSRARISSDPQHPEQVRLNLGMNVATFGKPLAFWTAAAICAFFARRVRGHSNSAAA